MSFITFFLYFSLVFMYFVCVLLLGYHNFAFLKFSVNTPQFNDIMVPKFTLSCIRACAWYEVIRKCWCHGASKSWAMRHLWLATPGTRWLHVHRTSLFNYKWERTVWLAGRYSTPWYHQHKFESGGFIISRRIGFFNFVTGVVTLPLIICMHVTWMWSACAP